jgi:hypothetical protein
VRLACCHSGGVATIVLAAMVAAVALASSGRRDGPWAGVLVGAAMVAVGLGVLFLYWAEYAFFIDVGGTSSCADRVGIPVAEARDRTDFVYRRSFFPPSVTCGFGSDLARLTPRARTDGWAGAWVAGWILIGLGLVVEATGLVHNWRRGA